ncbi:MAG TPA: hypothetical protein VEK39_12635 [Solirubrobacterales bacterium]|nr:hypothetical protein [Solirubrobacterales bacterium]
MRLRRRGKRSAVSEVAPEQALTLLADQLRVEDSVISPHVQASGEVPALGLLVAASPRTRGARGDYALLVEAIREGYLLHYGSPRVVVGADDDLALLAGDYLYALGLKRLSTLGDLEAVRELSDLISLLAQLHAGGTSGGGDDGRAEFTAGALWLAAVIAVAAGPSDGHEQAKAALRSEHPNAAAALLADAQAGGARAGIPDVLGRTADSIGLGSSHLPDLG